MRIKNNAYYVPFGTTVLVGKPSKPFNQRGSLSFAPQNVSGVIFLGFHLDELDHLVLTSGDLYKSCGLWTLSEIKSLKLANPITTLYLSNRWALTGGDGRTVYGDVAEVKFTIIPP